MASDAEIKDRKKWMGVLAKADITRLEALWIALDLAPTFEWLRRPETGTTMVEGRMGAVGDGFNLGEITVTRCALRLDSGADGHAYVQGRSKRHAEIAALCDGLMQGPERARVAAEVIAPLEAGAAAARAHIAARAKASKVDFFTLMRGED